MMNCHLSFIDWTRPVPEIDSKFFQFYFESELKNSAKEGNGSAIVNMPPFDVVKNWYFLLPPLAEQKRIVERLTELLAVCDELK